jgi:hypothetical protein
VLVFGDKWDVYSEYPFFVFENINEVLIWVLWLFKIPGGM